MPDYTINLSETRFIPHNASALLDTIRLQPNLATPARCAQPAQQWLVIPRGALRGRVECNPGPWCEGGARWRDVICLKGESAVRAVSVRDAPPPSAAEDEEHGPRGVEERNGPRNGARAAHGGEEVAEGLPGSRRRAS